MFKSIEYKLILWMAVLVGASCGSTLFAAKGDWFPAAGLLFVAVWAVIRLLRNYRKFNFNLMFLLNALDNGDLSFHFSTTKLSRREREINAVLNRIKEILATARREVMENETFLSLVVESTAAGIVIAEENDSIRIANRAALRMLGLPVFTHLKQLSFIDRSYPGIIMNMRPSKPQQIKVANEMEELLISLTVTRVRIRERDLRVFSLTSIGNELEAREMESWIKLIRVMTHEIMNSIAPITSLSDTLLEAYGESSGGPGGELLDDTVEAFRTINSTAKGLLTFVESYRRFTGIPAPEPTPTDMGELIRQTLSLESARLARAGVKVTTGIPDEPLLLSVDKSQIRQVMVNLLKNASEAVSGKRDGEIKVTLAGGQDLLTVEVRNNGHSIPRDIEPHIFIPFFTTKETGTGIGLSLSRYLMRLHGGNLKYHRTDGWTVFSMVFPGNPAN